MDITIACPVCKSTNIRQTQESLLQPSQQTQQTLVAAFKCEACQADFTVTVKAKTDA